MRNQKADQDWLLKVGKELAPGETLYVTPEPYDGGYELRLGTVTIFVEYEIIDGQEMTEVERRFKLKL